MHRQKIHGLFQFTQTFSVSLYRTMCDLIFLEKPCAKLKYEKNKNENRNKNRNTGKEET